MMDWKQRLDEQKYLIADGAWGTELAKLGLGSGEAPERWNLEQPDRVRSVAAAYVEAGADIVLTNTFGGNRFKLEKAGLDSRVAEINRRGAKLSKEAAAGRAFVFASIGPSGEFLQPLGALSEADALAAFAEQAAALADGGADGVVVETMSDLNEAKAAVRAVKENAGLPVAASMTFAQGPKGFATMMGVTPEAAAAELQAAGADIVGANCGAGMADMVSVVRAMRRAASCPIWAKPNAGMPRLVNGETVFPESPEEMAQRLPELVEAGANIVGGCCGSTPAHIRLLAQTYANLARASASYLSEMVNL